MTTCHVCLRMKKRKPFLEQEGPSTMCVLCSRPYCQVHKATNIPDADENVCEINHKTYYVNHYRSRAEIFLNLKERADAKGKTTVEDRAQCKTNPERQLKGKVFNVISDMTGEEGKLILWDDRSGSLVLRSCKRAYEQISDNAIEKSESRVDRRKNTAVDNISEDPEITVTRREDMAVLIEEISTKKVRLLNCITIDAQWTALLNKAGDPDEPSVSSYHCRTLEG